MAADILDAIDETLEWYGSADSVTWCPPDALPVLTPREAAVARQLSASTGMDGYAAWFAVADVSDHGERSPRLRAVLDAAREVRDESTAAPAISAVITVDVTAFMSAMDQLTTAAGEGAKSMAALSRAFLPQCPRSGPGPLCINGHEYHRRQKARKKRGR